MLFEGGTHSILIDGWAGVGGEGSRSWFEGGLDAIMESQLCTNVQQHVVLEDTNQWGGNLALCSKGRPVEGALEEVEGGDQPLNCLVTIAGAMDGDRRDSQGSASPWASPEHPGPGGGCALTWRKTQAGTAGGKKTVSMNIFGMKWKRRPICEMGMLQQCVALLQSHLCLGGGDEFPMGDGGGTGSKGILMGGAYLSWPSSSMQPFVCGEIFSVL